MDVSEPGEGSEKASAEREDRCGCGFLATRDQAAAALMGSNSLVGNRPGPQGQKLPPKPPSGWRVRCSFDGRCEEAVAFYREALGAEVEMLMRFKNSAKPSMTPFGADDQVMQMRFRIGNTIVIASDGRCLGKPSFQGFACRSPLLTTPKPRHFTALAADGQIQMPLAKGQGVLFLTLWHGGRPALACYG